MWEFGWGSLSGSEGLSEVHSTGGRRRWRSEYYPVSGESVFGGRDTTTLTEDGHPSLSGRVGDVGERGDVTDTEVDPQRGL